VEESLLFGCIGPTSRIGREIRISALTPHVGLERPTYDKRYELYAWCVMANHVHVVLTPIWKLERLLQGIKGFTSYQINQLQDARGRTLWQDESFDHWTREEVELIRIIQYVENNPVAAGLCACPEDWLWSSARFRTSWPVGQPFHAGALTPLESSL
jgi:REP element-mobilizing transposase RayT